MRERRVLQLEIERLKERAARYVADDANASSWIEQRAGELVAAMRAQPEYLRWTGEQVLTKAREGARREWFERRGREASEIEAARAEIAALIDDAGARARRVDLPNPAILDEATANKLITGEKVLVSEERQTRHELQRLRHALEYRGLSVDEQLAELEEAQGRNDWPAAAYLDDRISRALASVPSDDDVRRDPSLQHTHSARRDRLDRLRDARLPEGFAEAERELAQALSAATAPALHVAAVERVRAHGGHASTEEIMDMLNAGKAVREAQASA
jgi:hypothetical protein